MCSTLHFYFARRERVEQGLGSRRASAEGQLESWRGAEQSRAGTGYLFARREYGGCSILGACHAAGCVARESPARPDTWRIRRGPSWVLFYFCEIYFCPPTFRIVMAAHQNALELCHLQALMLGFGQNSTWSCRTLAFPSPRKRLPACSSTGSGTARTAAASTIWESAENRIPRASSPP